MYSLWGNRLVEAKESFTVENCDLIAAEFGRLFAPLAVVGGASGATAAAASDLRYQHVKNVNDQLEQWHSEILIHTQRSYQAPLAACLLIFFETLKGLSGENGSVKNCTYQINR